MATPPPKLTSDLCKPLPLVLTDDSRVSMLDYFIQFMDKEKAIHLVQFWLSVEAFKATPPSRGCSDDVTCVPGSHDTAPHCNGSTSHEKAVGISYSNQPESVSSHMTVTRPDVCTDSNVTLVQVTESTDDLYKPAGLFDINQTTQSTNVDISSAVSSTQGSLSVATDAMEIYTVFIALNALTPVEVPNEVRQRIEVSICPEDGVINRQCFNESQDCVYNTLETRYQLEYISSGQLCLLDFLLADNALFYLMEYMEQEGASSLVQFWLMADNFYRHLSSPQHKPDINLDTSDAIAIYDRFFSLQASEPLRMGDAVRMNIENNICSEHGPKTDSFSQAQDTAYHSMNQAFYPNFLRSSIYLRFLNELVHMLNVSNGPTPSGGAATPHSHRNRQGPAECRDDLDNPDNLWQRTLLPMRMGFVDQFGRYTSEVECILRDTSRSAGRFAWLRRRQQEEELTMKIAVNIVSEVMESVRLKDRH